MSHMQKCIYYSFKKVICYIQIVYEKRSLNVSKRSGQLSFFTYVSVFADENIISCITCMNMIA
ncbi:conserved hypothetical protein [Trichinella spiralis]|uniref:hypothetical protein n=1 Tax=Trichinella spiralis TaxID=6334 RepID=UPI0001EFE9AE|nr:conserved hypothetical protein [Trichinella spiralis]